MKPVLPPRVLIAHDKPQGYLEELHKRFPEIAVEAGTTAEEILRAVEAFDPTVVFSCKTPALGGVEQRPVVTGKSVQWIHVAGAGFDHLGSWDHRRMTVTNSSGVLSRFLAETVIGAIIMMNYGFDRYVRHQGRRSWEPVAWMPLETKTLLIVGLGSIGRDLARNAKHHGMTVLGVRRGSDKVPEVDEQLPLERLHEGLARADFVALHCPLTAETRHLIDTAALAAMKPDAVLINAARGPVVDEAALIATLQAGAIKGACLDVTEKEPLPAESPLWDLENVVISPHYADQVDDWEYRFAVFFMENLERWVAGDALENVVDPERGY